MTLPFVGAHTESDWETWGGQNYAVVGGSVRVAVADRLQYVTPTWVISEPPLAFEIVDLDIDNCGDIWLLTSNGELYRYSPGHEELRRIHCGWKDPPKHPRGVAVINDTVLVAIGDVQSSEDTHGRIHAFSRHLMQTRWIVEESYTDPVALVRHGEAVSVLDRGEGTPFLAEVDRGGAPIRKTTGFRSPVDLAIDDTGDRYVLDREDSAVYRVPAEETSVHTAVPSKEFVIAGAGERLEPIVLAAGTAGEVIVGVDNAVSTEPSLFRHEQATGEFRRLTTYNGPVTTLVLRRGDEVRNPGLYVTGNGGNSLSLLPATERNRLNPDTGRYDAQVVTRLDAGERNVQWHRLTTSLVSTETGTQSRVYYHATDDADLQFREPGTGPVIPLERVDGIGKTIADRLRAAYIRGVGELIKLSPGRLAQVASTDSYPVSSSRTADWLAEASSILDQRNGPADLNWQSVGPPNPEDALLSDAEGRYLWVKVELIGTAAASPRLESLRAYFPRQSYLRYLPELYRDDPDGAAFLERYLSMFESVFTDIEEEISASTRYLDPDGIPGEALSWLADWLALSPNGTWSTDAKRKLVRQAHELFTVRGTRAGLHQLLLIYLADRMTRPPAWQWAIDRQRETIDERESANELDAARADRLRERLDRTLFIWEQSDLDCIDNPSVREIYERLLPCPQCFAVLLWPSLSDDTIREAQRLIETTRPAHAVGRAIRLQPSIRLTGTDHERGHHSYLGVNSALADRTFVLESSGLGTDSKLSEHEPYGQYDIKERLGVTTDLS